MTSDRRRFGITIIGDVRVEARAELRGVAFAGLSRDTFVFSPVRFTISGTAVNMAREAVSMFARTEVIARIGDDEFSAVIRDHLQKIGAVGHLVIDEGCRNGGIIIIRDDDKAGAGGLRLLVSGEPAPSHRLSEGDIKQFSAEIGASDLLLVDGYSILHPPSALAVYEAMRIARESKTQVCLDLVPHNIYEFLRLDEIQGYVSLADYIIVEARTLAEYLALPHQSPPSAADVDRLLPHIDARFPGTRCWLLRHGVGNMEDVVRYKKGIEYSRYSTGYASVAPAERAGYGDKVAVRELAHLLAQRS